MDYNQGARQQPGQQPPQQPGAGAAPPGAFPQFPGGHEQYPSAMQQMLAQQQRHPQALMMGVGGGPTGPTGGGGGYGLHQQQVAAPPVQAPFPGPQNVAPQQVQQPQPSAAAVAAAARQEQIRRNAAAGLQNIPMEYMGDLSKYSVSALVIIGKEITSELNVKVQHMWMVVQPSKNHDPEPHLEYINKLFEQLLQIRILIEEKTTGNEISLTDIFNGLRDMSDPVDARPAELVEKEKIFIENRKKLVELSCDLKQLDWLSAVSDPGSLKRVDKMQTTRDTNQP